MGVILPNTTIKPSTITRAGYEYQDLVGIEVLINFYRNPNDYLWVELEADIDSSLDDVVAARADGSFEFRQVKFTVSSEDYLLDWDWLTERKQRGTSKLTKWEKSLRELAAKGAVHSAELRTNRVPSPEVAACLVADRVNLDLVPAATRTILEEHCGGAAQATVFFEKFTFVHTQRNLPGYEALQRDKLVGIDLEPEGWLYFRDQVRNWTMLRKQPPPDGRILYEHLRQVITRQRPQPIRQDFRVPADYVVPSSGFNKGIMARFDAKEPLTIVWGTPGRGKSTYLSFLADKLKKDDQAVIRHHYFLAMDDTTPDRLSFATIEASLVNQIFAQYPDAVKDMSERDADLRPLLEKVAAALSKEGQRLFVFVDGLDHVWRDSAKVDQLNQLFNHLLPLPEHVSLVVGTQRVPDEQLPKKLIVMARQQDWIEIPPMEEPAVSAWVKAQDSVKRLVLNTANPSHHAEVLDAVAASFFRISGGHPLHLIFAFESLVRTNQSISVDDVDRLPPCPDGDIRKYYALLWLGLSVKAKEILTALGGSDFHWPASGVRMCFGSFEEVDFLLENRHSGLVPFHASIFAYVRERSDHPARYATLLPRIINWLENDADDFWRWGWLWLAKSSAGDSDDLVTETTRDWVVDSLAAGWPERQMIVILEAAERCAFERMDLARTVVLHWMKVRLLNAREFQSNDYAGFEAAALIANENWQQFKNLTDDLPSLLEDELVALAAMAPSFLRGEVRPVMLDELIRRINVWIELRHRPEQEFIQLIRALINVLGREGEEACKRLQSFLSKFKEPESLYIDYARSLGGAINLEVLISLNASLKGPKWTNVKRVISGEIVRTAGFLGVDLAKRSDVIDPAGSPLRAAWFRLRDRSDRSPFGFPLAPDKLGDDDVRFGRDPGLSSLLHSVFFSGLANALIAEGEYSFIYPGVKRDSIGWLSVAIEHLEKVARSIASNAIEPSFGAMYEAAEEVQEVPFLGNSNEAEHTRYIAFKRALKDIARDLHIVSRGMLPASQSISAVNLAIARKSVHWVESYWLSQDVDDERRLLAFDAASQMLQDNVSELSKTITVFNERADAWSQLAKFSIAYGLGNERELTRRSAACICGYGYRKDLSAIDVLDAVKEAYLADGADALPALRRLVPIVEQITKFTDGDETDHVRSKQIEVVAQTHPEKLPDFYSHYVSRDKWRYADQCLQEIVATADLTGDPAKLLISTFLDNHTLDALKKAGEKDAGVAGLFDKQIEFVGGAPIRRRDRASSSDGLFSEKSTPKSATRFAATSFGDVAVAVGETTFDYRKRESYLREWLTHWTSQGRGKEALDSIEAYFLSGRSTYDVEDILDAAFEASLAIQGKKTAYKWLVRAHVQRNGWQSYWASEDEVMRRLEWAAVHYPGEWWEFIVDTSKSDRYGRSTFVIGQRYLVRYLALAGKTDIAKQIADAFVEVLVDELEDQPIPEAAWFK